MTRNKRKRLEHKLIHIYTEGKTEQTYFSLFKSTESARKKAALQIKPINGKLQGLALMKYVRNHLKNIRREEQPNEVIVVFDKDKLPDEHIVQCMKDFPNYQIGFSNVSFELWLLLHFQKVYSRKSQNELEKALGEALGENYVKADDRQLEEVIEKLPDAMENAEGFEVLNEVNFRENPYTNLGLVIRQILGE